MKILLLLSSCLLTLKVFALEDFNDIINNYDIDCVEETMETYAGHLTSIVCLNKKLQRHSKIYLNKKLILEKPFPVRIMNIPVKIRYPTDKFFILKSDLVQNDNELKMNETKLYLLNTYEDDIKFYEFGLTNCHIDNVAIDVYTHATRMLVDINSVNQLSFLFENGKYSFSKANKNIQDKDENHASNYCEKETVEKVKHMKLSEINEFIKPYVNEIPINKEDPLINKKREYLIYEKVNTDVKTSVFADEAKKAYQAWVTWDIDPYENQYSLEYFTENIENKMNITKKIKTPLGEVRFYQGIRSKVTLFDGNKETPLLLSKVNTLSITPFKSNIYHIPKHSFIELENLPGYWDPNYLIYIPGILYINDTKTLIVGYNMTVSQNNINCGFEMFILDLSKNKPSLTTFGGYKVCSVIKNVQFRDTDKAKITIHPNLEYNYEDGKITIPSEKNYEIITNQFDPRHKFGLYGNIGHSVYLHSLEKINNPYQFSPPYAQKETIPYAIYRRDVFSTKEDVIIKYTSEKDKEFVFIRNNNSEYKITGTWIYIENFDKNGHYYLINVENKINNKFPKINCFKYSLFIDYSQSKPKYFKINIKNGCISYRYNFNEKDNSLLIYTSSKGKSHFKYIDGKFILPENNDTYEISFLEYLLKKGKKLKQIKGKELYRQFPPIVTELSAEEFFNNKS